MPLAIMMRLPPLFVSMFFFIVVTLLAAISNACAGNQREEVLADAIKLALTRSITDPRPPHLNFAKETERIDWQRWSESVSKRLHSRMPDAMVRREFLQTLWYEARRAGLEPALILGLIQVESGFRKYAISSVGARGYMQVMPFWTRVIGDGQPSRLFHMQANLRYGCSILRMYIDMERGDLFLALGRYNGSRGRQEYPNAVRAAWKRWEYT